VSTKTNRQQSEFQQQMFNFDNDIKSLFTSPLNTDVMSPGYARTFKLNNSSSNHNNNNNNNNNNKVTEVRDAHSLRFSIACLHTEANAVQPTVLHHLHEFVATTAARGKTPFLHWQHCARLTYPRGQTDKVRSSGPRTVD
jgi:hypothetical protein